jgi:glycerate dehydrogenase
MRSLAEHHIVFLDRGTIAPEIDVWRPAFEHTWMEYEQTAPMDVVERARDATVVINNKVPLTAETLARLPKLRLVAMAATGTDCVDTGWCAENGVTASNIRNYAVSTVPEHRFALILALKRRLIGCRQDVIAGQWQRSGQFCFFTHPISELRGACSASSARAPSASRWPRSARPSACGRCSPPTRAGPAWGRSTRPSTR